MNHSSKGVLPCVFIRSRNLRRDAAKVLTKIVEKLMIRRRDENGRLEKNA
jgi:hypothetical protein